MVCGNWPMCGCTLDSLIAKIAQQSIVDSKARIIFLLNMLLTMTWKNACVCQIYVFPKHGAVINEAHSSLVVGFVFLTKVHVCLDVHSYLYAFFLWEDRGGISSTTIRNTSLFSAISDSFSGSIPRRDQARSERSPRHLVLGRPLGHLPVGRTCLTNLSWDILDTW